MDEYSVAGGGGLRLKGAKVKKHKKKKDKVNDLEKALSTGEESSSKRSDADGEPSALAESNAAKDVDSGPGGEERGEDQLRKHGENEEEEDDSEAFVGVKTEAERRFEEVKRKKLLEMAASADARPHLLKTHKERVEELNTYLSKLSEHHDMPKIGPG